MAHVICFVGCGLTLPANETFLHIQTDRQAVCYSADVKMLDLFISKKDQSGQNSESKPTPMRGDSRDTNGFFRSGIIAAWLAGVVDF